MIDMVDKSNIRTDLHMHTTASDGTWGPERLMGELVDKKIGIFSVTDHNSVDNVEMISSLSAMKGLTLIPGVEVDVSYNDRNYHMLGYGIDIKNPSLLDMLEKNKSLMDKKDDESIKYLDDRGLNAAFSEYKSYVNNPGKGN